MQTAQLALRNFLQAFAQLQLDEMMAWWADDATAFFPVEHQRERLAGKAAIRVAFAQVIARFQAPGAKQLSLVAEDMHTQELGDMAVITFHTRNGPLSRRTFVLRQRNDEWRIVHLHGSNAPQVSG